MPDQQQYAWLETSSFNNMQDYEDELKARGYCLLCQGFGQNSEDGSMCQKCNGTGKS